MSVAKVGEGFTERVQGVVGVGDVAEDAGGVDGPHVGAIDVDVLGGDGVVGGAFEQAVRVGAELAAGAGGAVTAGECVPVVWRPAQVPVWERQLVRRCPGWSGTGSADLKKVVRHWLSSIRNPGHLKQ
ncbi:hypothetical protein [Streptomyces sp. NPDC001068]|uniref:hypothetical protein n=1 Tax=Streptomyces sp. NPDC001068 TaxID=3364544 RepID=UPI00367A6A0E